jgi:two-component system cell cycle sensor histidine kinase/response regulator CckA
MKTADPGNSRKSSGPKKKPEHKPTKADINGPIAGDDPIEKEHALTEAALNVLQEPFFVFDTEGRFLMWNDTLKSVTGYSDEEIPVMEPTDFFPEEQRPRVAEAIAAVIETGRAAVEATILTKDGRRIPFEFTGSLIKDAGGRPLGISGTGRDITSRRLMESEILLQGEIVRNMAEGVYLVSAENLKIIYANPKMEKMFGYDPGEMNGKHVSIINAPTGGDPVQTAIQIQKALLESGAWRGEVLNVKKDGTTFWSQASISMLHHPEHGEVYVSLQTDITKRKRAEQALLENEEFIRSILDNVDEGFLVIDRDYRIITANKAYCSQVRSAREDIIGKQCFTVSHHSPRPCYENGEDCAVRHVFETGKPHVAMHRHPDPEGAMMYVETRGFPLRDADGRVTSVIETITNVTERQLLEEERLKTQKLKAIGTLAGGIAHDFRNLLQGVFGFITVAKQGVDLQKETIDLLDQAEKALTMSVNLTNQLLTFSKGGTPVKKTLDLHPVIDNSARFALSGSRCDYRFTYDRDLWPVEADDGQIGQVIQNIVLNANESMPDGGMVEISAKNVSLERRENPSLPEGGKFVAILIEDSGTGIPPEYLSRIFDPYFTTKQKGSGLGLATSYSIVRSHGGVLEVKSQIGEGSVFSIYLPAGEPIAASAHPPLSPVAGRKGDILVMDDEEVVRLVAAEMLSSLGHEATCVETGEDAVEKFRQADESGHPFDVVILDLTVKGGMGGEQAAAKLREIDPQVRIIVSSGYSDSPVVSDYRSHGFAAFLNKPYMIEDLSEKLNALLVP